MRLASLVFVVGLLAATALRPAISRAAQGTAPIADAGLPRYAAEDPVVLDGTGSYDPDDPGPLSYKWRQISGPTVVITDADTSTPTISGFVQKYEIQECEFELIVSNGEYDSLPDTVRVVVVPYFGESNLRLENKSFDPNKPTAIYFGGGNCTTGHTGQYISDPDWLSSVNLIDFPYGYTPDSGGGARTYYKYGDMIIAYLSSVAPDYKQPIGSGGFSTGGQPGIDVGIRLNQTYRDARYAVNRVTFCDATPVCRDYSASISTFLGSSVDGEQCWVDNYVDNSTSIHPGVLNVRLSLSHVGVNAWYGNSLTGNDMNQFNNGIVAGVYWSSLGPGKNLQLGPAPGATYAFQWHGSATSGYMDFFDESLYPGRLPEPVTLAAWIDVSDTSQDMEGAVLTCHKSENAVGYELLFGSDPYRVMDYRIVSDTPHPPLDVIRGVSSEESWWTIRARDQYGSTIHADPVPLDLTDLDPPTVQNARTGIRYGLIGHAILDAEPGDTILLDPAIYEENVEFTMPLTVSSLEPNDAVVVAGTIVRGRDAKPTVTFSQSQCAECTLAGLTVQSNTVGISCRDAIPTIRSCVVESPDGIALEYWHGQTPRLIDCTILGQTKEGGDLGLIAYWKLDEAEGTLAQDSAGYYNGSLIGGPVWQPTGGMVAGALQFDGIDDYVTTPFVVDPEDGAFSVFAWVKGGAPRQVIVSQTGGGTGFGSVWLGIDAGGGKLTTGLMFPQPPLVSHSVITDGQWHRIGLVWDGSRRYLYVDELEVAGDALDVWAIPSDRGLNIGCGPDMTPGTYWSGLIDDVRIYNRAVKP
jgi:hypothetical protein